MKIELKGIIQYHDQGHRCLDVVVAVDKAAAYERHRVSIDKPAGRGKILKFLGDKYGVEPGRVVWPRHIKAGDI